MKTSLLAVIGTGIVILAIITILLIIPQESNVAEVEDTLDREILPVEDDDPIIQEAYDTISQNKLDGKYYPKPREWQTSGKFQIDRKEYVLGEKIFIKAGPFGLDEKGEVAFLRQVNETAYKVYLTIPFDGTQKEGFNMYIEPTPSKTLGICSKDDIIGKWELYFRGTNYSNLYFEIIDDVVPGDENKFNEVVC